MGNTKNRERKNRFRLKFKTNKRNEACVMAERARYRDRDGMNEKERERASKHACQEAKQIEIDF